MDTIHTFIYARWVQNQFSWETDKANSCDHLKVFFQLIYTHESEETKSALYIKLKLTNTMCIGTHYMRYTIGHRCRRSNCLMTFFYGYKFLHREFLLKFPLVSKNSVD